MTLGSGCCLGHRPGIGEEKESILLQHEEGASLFPEERGLLKPEQNWAQAIVMLYFCRGISNFS
jgi:hypothetical protein